MRHRRHTSARRRGIGTVLATAVFVFIAIFITANLIVWSIGQYAGYQTVVDQMNQHDAAKAAENVSIVNNGVASFGSAARYVCPGNGVCNQAVVSGTAKAFPIANMNFTSSQVGWSFTGTLPSGVTTGLSGGYDAFGSESGAVGSTSGPGLIYSGVSYTPAATVTFTGIWTYRFFLDLSKFGCAAGQNLGGTGCAGATVAATWERTVPSSISNLLQSGMVSFMISDGTNTFSMDQNDYGPTGQNSADATWVEHSITNTGGATDSGLCSGTCSADDGGTGGVGRLTDTSKGGWTANQWSGYYVLILTGTGQGEVGQISSNTSNQLTLVSAWPTTIPSGFTYMIGPVSPTTPPLSFWGVSGTPKWFSLVLRSDVTVTSAGGPAEFRVLYDDVGLTINYPASFVNQFTHIAIGSEDPTLISQLVVSTATAFSQANVQQSVYLKSWQTGLYDQVSSALVSQTSVNLTSTVQSANVQQYVCTTSVGCASNNKSLYVKLYATLPSSFTVSSMKLSVTDFYKSTSSVSLVIFNQGSATSHVVDLWVIDSSGHHCFSKSATGCTAWNGVYVAPGTSAVVTLTYNWVNGPVTFKAFTDVGNVATLQTNAG